MMLVGAIIAGFLIAALGLETLTASPKSLPKSVEGKSGEPVQ